MPRLRKDFPVTEPGSLGTYSVNFEHFIPAGTTLVSAEWDLAVRYVIAGATADPIPQTRVAGAAVVEQDTVSVQQIGALVAGNDYLVTVAGSTSDGETLVLWCVLPCRAPR